MGWGAWEKSKRKYRRHACPKNGKRERSYYRNEKRRNFRADDSFRSRWNICWIYKRYNIAALLHFKRWSFINDAWNKRRQNFGRHCAASQPVNFDALADIIVNLSPPGSCTIWNKRNRPQPLVIATGHLGDNCWCSCNDLNWDWQKMIPVLFWLWRTPYENIRRAVVYGLQFAQSGQVSDRYE